MNIYKLAKFIYNNNIKVLPIVINDKQYEILNELIRNQYKYDLASFIENCCIVDGKSIKLNDFQKSICNALNKMRIDKQQFIERENNMQQFIEECLKPLYQFQWLKTIPISEEIQQSIIFMVAYSDKRLF